MQIPIIPFRGKKKPWGSIPRINLMHPLARGLVFYAYDTGGGLVVDLISGSKPTRLNTANPSHKPSPFGAGLKYPGGATSGSLVWPALPAVNTILAARLYSIACAWYYTAVPGIAFTCSFGLNDAGNVSDASFLFNATATDDMQWSVNNNNPVAFTSNTLNKFHSLVGANTGATAQSVYFDGALKTTTALTASITTTTSRPCIGTLDPATTGQGNDQTGWIYYGAVWNRTVTSAEAFLLHNDPYCFLIYPEDEMFASLVGAGFNPATSMIESSWPNIGRKIVLIGDR